MHDDFKDDTEEFLEVPDRIISYQDCRHKIFLQVCAPTSASSKDNINDFYQQLTINLLKIRINCKKISWLLRGTSTAR